MAPIYLVCGVSGSGKSWVCRQVADKFNYVPHDRCWSHPDAKPEEGLDPKWGPKGAKSTHLETLLNEARSSKKPIISEVPFGERELKEKLEMKGAKVTPIFVIEEPDVVAKRYETREKKPLHKAAVTRASSIKERAKEWKAKSGTSDEILAYLKALDLGSRMDRSEWRKFNRS